MARGTAPKTERNQLIVTMRDMPVRSGEKRLSFAAIGQELRPRLTAPRVHEIYTREKKRHEAVPKNQQQS